MSRIFTVRVRFCGGCNPEMDRGETVREVMALLAGRAAFTFDPSAPADITLRVNGCAHACLDEDADPAADGPVISVQGLCVDLQPAGACGLAARIAGKIRDLMAEKEGLSSSAGGA